MRSSANLQFGDEVGGDVGTDVGSRSSFAFLDKLETSLRMLPHRRRHSLVTSSSVLRRLPVHFDQLSDVILRRRLRLFADRLLQENADGRPEKCSIF